MVGLSRGGAHVWRGIRFDHGGNSGTNIVFGGNVLRFRVLCERSRLDGKDALALTYEKNPWPASRLRDELRSIGPGLALGATLLGSTVIAWCGLAKS